MCPYSACRELHAKKHRSGLRIFAELQPVTACNTAKVHANARGVSPTHLPTTRLLTLNRPHCLERNRTPQRPRAGSRTPAAPATPPFCPFCILQPGLLAAEERPRRRRRACSAAVVTSFLSYVSRPLADGDAVCMARPLNLPPLVPSHRCGGALAATSVFRHSSSTSRMAMTSSWLGPNLSV